MPEREATQHDPDPDQPATHHRGPGLVSRAWNGYGARVRGKNDTLRAALTRALVQPFVAVAVFLTVGVAAGLVPVGGPLGDDLDAVLGDRLDGMLGMSPSNPIQGTVVPGTGEPLPPQEARAIERAVEESRRANLVMRLNADNDCYTSSDPAPTETPRWAVVTLPGQDPALLPSDVGFGIWLNGDPGEHHSFCP